ncbi:MAG: hypothetical protein C0623_07470 [Desulfuromonas sp.]|nr:MAG: hypothetical protein C0623_07470 [Desulfuromonas sp.]
MAGHRSAGYCSSCNRGVTIERPQKAGLMGRMRSAIKSTTDAAEWVCTKCGEPATRGFTPPPEFIPPTDPDLTIAENDPADNRARPQPAAEPSPHAETQEEPASPPQASTEPATDQKDLEANCHLCNKPVPFKKEAAKQQINCPGCQQPIVLPSSETDSSLLTTPPKITKLDDDPARPDVSKAICTVCNFELTYPKRLAGKNVECPSCSEKFILP